MRQVVRYILVGDGAFMGKARQLVAELGLKDVVILPGSAGRDEIRRYLAAFDIGLFISTDTGKRKFPGSPLKLFEYLAASLPVIVTGDSHLTPMVRDEGMGIVISEPIIEAIAAAVENVALHRDKYEAIGRHNRHLSEDKYCWLNVAREVARVCQGFPPSDMFTAPHVSTSGDV